MSIQSKYPGKCKDCKVPFVKGATISTNKNNNWCSKGKDCTATYSTTDSTTGPAKNPNASAISPIDTEKISVEIEKIIAIEKLVTAKLPSDTNPAKIGMYVKFLYDSSEKKI